MRIVAEFRFGDHLEADPSLIGGGGTWEDFERGVTLDGDTGPRRWQKSDPSQVRGAIHGPISHVNPAVAILCCSAPRSLTARQLIYVPLAPRVINIGDQY